MGTEGLRHGVRKCTHPESEALHDEVRRWVDGWAERIHAECPTPMSDREWGKHEAHEYRVINARLNEIHGSRPPHFKGCVLACASSIEHALFFELHGYLHANPGASVGPNPKP